MRSLLFRMVAVTLGVAVVSIAATAWLITRTSGETVRGAFEQTLEADSFVYQQLLAYAQMNDSWDGVDATITELAEEIGDRVALTTPEGTMISDSAAIDGHHEDLPPTPTAEVDARSAGLVALAGLDITSSALPTTSTGAVGTGFADAMSGAVSVTDSPVTWRLSDVELAHRAELSASANECFAAAGSGARVLVDDMGGVVVTQSSVGDIAEAEATTAAPTPDPSPAIDPSLVEYHECLPSDLGKPSQAARDLNDRIVGELTACLEVGGIDYIIAEGDDQMRTVNPAESAFDDPATFQTYASCFDTAQTAALDDVVADSALLYVGSTDRFDPLSGDGWAPVVMAGVGVLTVAAAVTAVSGRRLTRPIRALTTAAQRMGAGDRTARVPVSGHDEVTDLGRAFNSMAESIAAGEENRKAMVSDIAHELRTPLSNVRGYLEAAEDGVVPIDLDLVTSLREESDLLRHLVDDLQSLALADAGALRIHPVDVDAADLARQVVSAHRAAAADGGLSLSLDVPPGESQDADGLIVCADPTRMRQALGNVVGNAIRYTASGGAIVVTVSRSADAVTIAVADDGPGIPADHLDRVFDRFHRVEGSRSRDTGGSGLGLPIARSLVEAHGGTIEVISAEGEGSTFTITLPRPRT